MNPTFFWKQIHRQTKTAWKKIRAPASCDKPHAPVLGENAKQADRYVPRKTSVVLSDNNVVRQRNENGVNLSWIEGLCSEDRIPSEDFPEEQSSQERNWKLWQIKMVDQSRYAYPKGKNTRAWEKLDSTFKIFSELPYSTKCKRTFSRVQLFVTPWTVAHQGPLFMGFSRQEYWSGLSFPPPGDLLDPSIKPRSLCVSYTGSRFFTTGATWEAPIQGVG